MNNEQLKELLAKLAEEIGDMKVKDLLASVNQNDRLDKLEQEQQKTTKYLDRFVNLLSYSEQVQQQLEVIDNQVTKLWNAVNTVELLKGVIELPAADGTFKNELDFYTIKATGESGVSRNTLAKMCGVDRSTLSRLKDTLVKKAPSVYLKSYTGQELTLVTSDRVTFIVGDKQVGNLTIYKSDYCAAVITHYAMRGNRTALHYLANFCALGMTEWIHGITGWTSIA